MGFSRCPIVLGHQVAVGGIVHRIGDPGGRPRGLVAQGFQCFAVLSAEVGYRLLPLRLLLLCFGQRLDHACRHRLLAVAGAELNLAKLVGEGSIRRLVALLVAAQGDGAICGQQLELHIRTGPDVGTAARSLCDVLAAVVNEQEGAAGECLKFSRVGVELADVAGQALVAVANVGGEGIDRDQAWRARQVLEGNRELHCVVRAAEVGRDRDEVEVGLGLRGDLRVSFAPRDQAVLECLGPALRRQVDDRARISRHHASVPVGRGRQVQPHVEPEERLAAGRRSEHHDELALVKPAVQQ